MAKKRYKSLWMLTMLLIVTVLSCCVAETFVERFQAEQLLKVISDIDVGVSRQAEVEQALKPFSNYDIIERPSNRNTTDDDVEYLFRNQGFSALKLAPVKLLFISLDFHNGIVVASRLHFAEEPNRGAVLEVTTLPTKIKIAANENTPLARRVYERNSYSAPTYMLAIRDDVSASAARRKSDWDVDISCMTKLGECSNFRDMLRGALR